MSKKLEFIRKLDHLYRRRTDWLRVALGPTKPGRPSGFTRKDVNKGIRELQSIATDALAKKLAKEEFAKYAPSKRAWQVKGWGPAGKCRSFDHWFAMKIGEHRECVYVFWAKGTCIYVGRTGQGGSRPTHHFEKFWFGSVSRIVVYAVHQASQLPKLECLAMHRFLPRRNKIKAATEKWTKKCPLCEIHKDINSELRKIFRLK